MEREADASGEYIYDGKFQGNILVVGRTVSGKTTFIQKLGNNRMFGEEIANVFWVSKIRGTKERACNQIVLKDKRFTLATPEAYTILII